MKTRVLFLCRGNSARSQMAEALLRSTASDRYDVFSAGTAPEGLDPKAIKAIERFGLSTEGLSSKPMSNFIGQSFDFVITLCEKARQECEAFPYAKETIAWDFEDPKTRYGNHPYGTTLKELNERIKMFLLIQDKQQAS